MHHIDAAKSAARNMIFNAVKFIAFNNGGFRRIKGITGIVFVRQIIDQINAFSRQAPERPPPRQDVFPQLLRRIGSGVATRHTDNGYAADH